MSCFNGYPHDWRLIGETPASRVELIPDGRGDYRTIPTVKRRWCCTRCRTIERTEDDST